MVTWKVEKGLAVGKVFKGRDWDWLQGEKKMLN